MYKVEPSERVELGFGCEPPLGEYRRTPRWGGETVEVESLVGSCTRPIASVLDVPPDTLLIVFNSRGTVLVRSEYERRWIVCAEKSAVFIRGPLRVPVNVARGLHSAHMITWRGWVTPQLTNWLNQRLQAESEKRLRLIASKPIDPQFSTAHLRFEQALAGPTELIEPMLISVLYELVPRLILGKDELQLAPLPPDLPPSIRKLADHVCKNPGGQWPLKDAAAAAGYSPFHFSRVFKSLVGYGFHEFVDRCRTEFAVSLLCETEEATDLIAQKAGFGTTQGLRESIKEYLGLVPSELRMAAEPISES
jgi:AraC-like DNA-binding protein